jgi:hypothetical protein
LVLGAGCVPQTIDQGAGDDSADNLNNPGKVADAIQSGVTYRTLMLGDVTGNYPDGRDVPMGLSRLTIGTKTADPDTYQATYRTGGTADLAALAKFTSEWGANQVVKTTSVELHDPISKALLYSFIWSYDQDGYLELEQTSPRVSTPAKMTNFSQTSFNTARHIRYSGGSTNDFSIPPTAFLDPKNGFPGWSKTSFAETPSTMPGELESLNCDASSIGFSQDYAAASPHELRTVMRLHCDATFIEGPGVLPTWSGYALFELTGTPKASTTTLSLLEFPGAQLSSWPFAPQFQYDDDNNYYNHNDQWLMGVALGGFTVHATWTAGAARPDTPISHTCFLNCIFSSSCLC